MRATKKFVVIAYDISATKRRNKVVKILAQYGVRVNRSVYECMFTEAQLAVVMEELNAIAHSSRDRIIYYSLCLDCYARICYYPDKRKTSHSCTTII